MRSLESSVHAIVLAALATLAAAQQPSPGDTLDLLTRVRTGDGDRAEGRPVRWESGRTAVVICDMWDRHWCKGATRRVADMAPRMNAVIAALRRRGVLIIHCPSGTLGHYAGSAARALAESAPQVATKVPLQGWCHLDRQREGALPIDDRDGGCDCQPRCKSGSVWKRQIPALDIVDGDAMSDSATAFYLMQQRGITHVIVMGVHTNMCVLGRPFGIRQLVTQGMDVVLMRDLTDTMYNSRSAPFVDHHAGTDLVIRHIERHWCPTVTSDQILGGRPHRFADDGRKRLAIVMAEQEYDTRTTLPALAKEHLKDWRVTLVHADPDDRHRLPGLTDALRDADVALLSIRRRAPTAAQMRALRRFLAQGGGLVGIRTTSHAFDPKDPVPAGHATWPEFDREVLGGFYQGHHGNKRSEQATRVWVAAAGRDHPILAGVPAGEIPVRSWLYKHLPLAKTATPLLLGKVGDGGEPVQPVAWTRVRDDGGRVFYTSLGHPDEFRTDWFPRLLCNGIRWAAQKDAAPAGTTAPKREQRDGGRPEAPTSWAPGALSPAESHRTMRTPADLAVDLLLAEPVVEQPVFLDFDERGRMWVVQYRQYPHPAGLRITSRDRLFRNVYDKVPPPPPHAADSPFRGADRITIHEDRDGDGTFDSTAVFLDGLNMCTSLAIGRGGVWVLNPPYLLFYPDRNRDDVPDGPPVVHLRGFWLEDSHSIANSLRFGPDGWLYGAQGSTVTADITVELSDSDRKVHTQGQQIWRYHPERHVFEVFAEGGGNAFGCEIDAAGRVFSGHNGGDTRGFHYPQGGYLRKGFEKHGPLSNPYAFGFFPHMPHHRVARFSHNFIVYEGDGLPERYRGRIFAVDPINRYVPIAERIADGATFRTRDVDAAIRTEDSWFRPVDIKHGPDGAVYLCDWYDAQVNHYRNHEGRIDKRNGRIYRIRGAEPRRMQPFDLGALGTAELIALLRHDDRWHREQARRLLGDRRDQIAGQPELDRMLRGDDGRAALESLWVLHVAGRLTGDRTLLALRHRDAHVRLWTVRVIGDRGTRSPAVRAALRGLASGESHPEVRSQLAATAKRLPFDDCVAIFDALTGRDVDRKDRYIPLQLWWALESKCTTDPDRVVSRFASAPWWTRPIVREQILWRVMRRFAATGRQVDLLRCARLLAAAPDPESRRHLMDGFEQAFEGRAMDGLPAELTRAIEASGVRSLAVDVRRGEPHAVGEALQLLADRGAPLARRSTYGYLLAELQERRAVPVMLAALDEEAAGVRAVMLRALQGFAEPAIGTAVLARYPKLEPTAAEVARVLLGARPEWSLQLVAAIDAGSVDPKSFTSDDVTRLRLHDDPKLRAAIDRIWGQLRRPTPDHLRAQITRIRAVLAAGQGNPYRGKPLFLARCAACHRLFADGADIGPDLTTFDRTNLDGMLLAIVNPNAEIREGFERVLVTMRDGRLVTGSIADEGATTLVLRGIDGRRTPLAKARIAAREPVDGSLMPAGLLDDLGDEQLRDLFGYLRTTQPQVK